MASNNLSLVTPPIFIGENYTIWSVKMQSYLESFDLWEVVVEDRTISPFLRYPILAQIKANIEEKTKRYKGKTVIQNLVSDSIFPKIMT